MTGRASGRNRMGSTLGSGYRSSLVSFGELIAVDLPRHSLDLLER